MHLPFFLKKKLFKKHSWGFSAIKFVKGIKKYFFFQGNDKLLQEIGCVESLRKVASGPNGIASKYAAQTLRLIGEDVPHKLSQQV